MDENITFKVNYYRDSGFDEESIRAATEDMKNTAYQAYLEYLHSHPEWFTNAEQDFIRATEKCLIAIKR